MSQSYDGTRSPIVDQSKPAFLSGAIYGLAKIGVKFLEGKIDISFDIFTQSKISMLIPQIVNRRRDRKIKLNPTNTLGDILSQPHKIHDLRKSSLKIGSNIKY